MKIIKYFFEFISIISFFCIFKLVGLSIASNLGSILGRLVGPLSRSKEITKQNIRIGLGEIDEKNKSGKQGGKQMENKGKIKGKQMETQWKTKEKNNGKIKGKQKENIF